MAEFISVLPNKDFPNSFLPVLVYPRVFDKAIKPEEFEKLLAANHWHAAWRSTIYPYDHYHSTSHEFLGIACGKVDLKCGGKEEAILKLKAGDAVLLPAGVAHRSQYCSEDLLVVGGYPSLKMPDVLVKNDDRKAAELRIAQLTIPETDPIEGKEGQIKIWRRSGSVEKHKTVLSL